MSRNDELQLKEGAVLVCDAHYSRRRPELLSFLRRVSDGRIPATQLILLGDIFDLLFGPIPKTLERNREAVALINAIASKMDVVYFEGNHDFRLEGVFEGVRIVPLSQQPLRVRYQGKLLYMAHGDLLTTFSYRCYAALIRNPAVLQVLRWADALFGHPIIRRLDAYLDRKEDCNTFDNFEGFVRRRLLGTPYENADYFIEGHYHQNRVFTVGKVTYLNPAAFACNQRYFIVQSTQQPQLLREQTLGKETGC